MSPDEGFVAGLDVLPGGEILAAKTHHDRIVLLDGDRRFDLFEMPDDRISDPMYSPTGHIVFLVSVGSESAAGVWAVPFSLARKEVTGLPFRVLPPGSFSLSANGTMAYVPEPELDRRQLVLVDRTGSIEETIHEPMMRLRHPSIAPDGRRIAFSAMEDGLSQDIYIFDRVRGTLLHLPDEHGNDSYPVWWDDGAAIVFGTVATGILHLRKRRADGLGDVHRIAYAHWSRPSRDGRHLLFRGTALDGETRGLLYMEEGSENVRVALPERDRADLSPNNRYLACYRRNERGIYLRRFPGGESQTLITSLPANHVRWSLDGKALFFWSEDAFMVVSVDSTSDEPAIGIPETLFTATADRLSPEAFDILDDGRFLMVQHLSDPDTASDAESILIILNWPAGFEDS